MWMSLSSSKRVELDTRSSCLFVFGSPWPMLFLGSAGYQITTCPFDVHVTSGRIRTHTNLTSISGAVPMVDHREDLS